MTTPKILSWFKAPELESLVLRRRAKALWVVSWPFFAVVALVLGVAVLVEPQTAARRAVTVASVGILIAILHAISRAGRPVLASWVLVIGLSILVTQRAWITGGIFAPVAVFYLLFIVMAAVLIGPRGGFVTAVTCLIGSIVLTAGTSDGWLAKPANAGSPLGAFVFVVLAIGLALVLNSLMMIRPRQEALNSDAVRMLVHDMRSPVHVVMAHLDLLKHDLSGEGAKDLESAIAGVSRINDMTTTLLDVSRIEAGKMPVKRTVVDLAALAETVVRDSRVVQPGRNIVVEALADASCKCDPDLTMRVVENLVGNAMHHTPLESKVRVIITGSRDRIYFAVQDEGPGIPMAKRAGIFEPFNSEGILSGEGYQSCGLGLAFCKAAVEAQGGSIRVEDVRPRGSAFIVELPRRS